jgi:hypothetical protein
MRIAQIAPLASQRTDHTALLPANLQGRRKEGGVIAAGIVIMEIGNLGKESN